MTGPNAAGQAGGEIDRAAAKHGVPFGLESFDLQNSHAKRVDGYDKPGNQNPRKRQFALRGIGAGNRRGEESADGRSFA